MGKAEEQIASAGRIKEFFRLFSIKVTSEKRLLSAEGDSKTAFQNKLR